MYALPLGRWISLIVVKLGPAHTPKKHLPTPGQRGHSPQRHTAADTRYGCEHALVCLSDTYSLDVSRDKPFLNKKTNNLGLTHDGVTSSLYNPLRTHIHRSIDISIDTRIHVERAPNPRIPRVNVNTTPPISSG